MNAHLLTGLYIKIIIIAIIITIYQLWTKFIKTCEKNAKIQLTCVDDIYFSIADEKSKKDTYIDDF